MEPKTVYPDAWDGTVAAFALQQEPWPNYWAESEWRALEQARSWIKRMRRRRQADGNRKCLLDIGAGQGRLLSRFVDLFDQVVAVEPDPKRITLAQQEAVRGKWENVSFVEGLFLDRVEEEPDKFDVVLCSHVLQHIPSGDVGRILDRIASILTHRGLLVLVTVYSRCKEDSFQKLSRQRGSVIEYSLESEKAFNESLIRYRNSDEVPTHCFAVQTLTKELKRCQLRIRKLHYFHEVSRRRWLDGTLVRDWFINWPIIQGCLGRDVLVIAEKGGK
jgi:2-polyprenyl-3-methyl-5-hydroxy-6-metoxy-1,4-benzoquinol methylase